MGAPEPVGGAPRGSAGHYDYSTYMDKARWTSTWHQVDEVLRTGAGTVLEVGKGTGVLGAILKHSGLRYFSLDAAADLKPDCVGSVTRLPFSDNSFDAACCFQVLEHLPFGSLGDALAELNRVSRHSVIISLPDAGKVWEFALRFSKYVTRSVRLTWPSIWSPRHVFDGEHHWEIGKRGYPLERIVEAMNRAGLQVVRSYRVPGHPYHRVFVTSVVRGMHRPQAPVSARNEVEEPDQW